MNNLLRDWYLGALGVVQYRPRDELEDTQATAANEVEYSIAEDIDGRRSDPSQHKYTNEHHPGSPTRVSGAFEEQRKQANEALAPPKAAKPIRRQSATRTPERAAESSDYIQFRLAFWQPSDAVVVFSAMPPRLRPGPAQQTMLTNLLKAIGQLPQPLGSAELIDWPLSQGSLATLQGATDLLGAFLDVKMRLKPFQYALLMGEVAARVTAGAKLAPGDSAALACGAQGIVTHSLHDMENNPALKRDTWSAIKHMAEKG